MPGKDVSRRMVMGVLGGGVLAAPAIASALTGSKAELALAPDGSKLSRRDATAQLVAPLVPGAQLARWTIVSISQVDCGAIDLVVRGEQGHEFRLEILARDHSPLAPRPPAETDLYAIHVVNEGDGWLPTVEEQGLAAMTLAQVVAQNEQAVQIQAMLTHSQRVAIHSDKLFEKDVDFGSAL